MTHAAGTICFAELVTSNEEAAKEYYGDLFDWTTLDVLSTSGAYALFQAKGGMVAGLRHAEERPQQWIPYVAASSLDDTLARAQALGARVVDPPFDVPGIARMATFADPAGAVLGLWQANGSEGSDVQDQPGTLWWVELLARDVAAPRAFYSALFGWEVHERTFPHMNHPYTVFKIGSASVSGIGQTEPEWGVTEHWSLLFAVTNADATKQRAEGLGGRHEVTIDVADMGRLIVLRDDGDARFAVMQPLVRVSPA